MKVESRLFGSIDIEENKIIHFVNGLVGFPNMTEFALIHDADNEGGRGIQWLQSMQEGNFAIPIIDPLQVLDEYNPTVEDELLSALGEMKADDMLVFVTVTVPSDITKMTVNLKGPIIINVNNCKACQVIAEGEKCEVKFPIYDILKKRKGGE